MGKIYKNGILFAGSTENARSVAFDNTDTGIEADNVQAAIEEIKDDVAEINSNLSKAGIVYKSSDMGFATNANGYKVLIKYKVPEDGLYLCKGDVSLLGATSNQRMLLNLNSTQNELATSSENNYPHTYKTASVFNIAQLNANEEITLMLYTDVVVKHDCNSFLFLVVRLK